MSKKKQDRVKQLTNCLIHVQENLKFMYQERLPTEVKIGVEMLYKDIEKVLKEL